MNTKDNASYRRTHQAITDAVVELALDRPINKVSVREVCERAGIHRSTFYLHFSDVYNVLDQTTEELARELIELYQAVIGDGDWLRVFSDTELETLFLRHIYDHRDFYRVYLSAIGEKGLARGMDLLWKSVVLPTYQKLGIDEEHGGYYFEFGKAGVIAVVRRWLEASEPKPPEEIAQILVDLLAPSRLSRCPELESRF